MIAREGVVDSTLYAIVEEEDALLRSTGDALIAGQTVGRTREEPSCLCGTLAVEHTGTPSEEEEVVEAVAVVVDMAHTHVVGVERTDVLTTSDELAVVGVRHLAVGNLTDEELSEIVPAGYGIVGRLTSDEDVRCAVVVEVANIDVTITKLMGDALSQFEVVESGDLGVGHVHEGHEGAVHLVAILRLHADTLVVDVALQEEVGIAVVVQVEGAHGAESELEVYLGITNDTRFEGVLERTVALIDEHADIGLTVAADSTPTDCHDVGTAVEVEVGHISRTGIPLCLVAVEVEHLERSVASQVALSVVQIDACVVVALTGSKDVDVAIAVEVGRDDGGTDTIDLVGLCLLHFVVSRAVPLQDPRVAVYFHLVALGILDDGRTGRTPLGEARYDEFFQTVVVQVDLTTASIVVGQLLVDAADGDLLGIGAECQSCHSCERCKIPFHHVEEFFSVKQYYYAMILFL